MGFLPDNDDSPRPYSCIGTSVPFGLGRIRVPKLEVMSSVVRNIF